MKWKTDHIGDTRIVKRFAYFPVSIDGGYTVWLEPYYSHEVLRDWPFEYPIWERYKATQQLEGEDI